MAKTMKELVAEKAERDRVEAEKPAAPKDPKDLKVFVFDQDGLKVPATFKVNGSVVKVVLA